MNMPLHAQSIFIWPHTAILAICLVISAAAQVLLKMGASGRHVWWQSLFDRRTLLGYGAFAFVTVAMMYAMQRLDLKFVVGSQSLIYVLVALGARLVLKERFSRRHRIGLLLIVAGVIVFNLY